MIQIDSDAVYLRWLKGGRVKINPWDLVIRILTIPVGVLGLFLLVTSISMCSALLDDLLAGGKVDWLNVIVTLHISFFMVVLPTAVGTIAIHAAIGLWRRPSVSLVRRMAFMISIVLWLCLSNLFVEHPSEVSQDPTVQSSAASLIVLLVSTLFFCITTRVLISRSSLEEALPMPASRPWVFLFCLLLWSELGSLSTAIFSGINIPTDHSILLVDLTQVLIPALICIVFYKVMIRVGDRRYQQYLRTKQPELSVDFIS